MTVRIISKLVNDLKYICDEVQTIESSLSGLQARKESALERFNSEITAIDEEIRNLNLALQESEQRMTLYKNRLKGALDEEQSEVGSV